MDAWDGYPVERAQLFTQAFANDTNLVVLAGDTHNAWANNLRFQGEAVGVEFATPSVTSPGLEDFLNLTSSAEIQATEAGIVQLIQNLKYLNLSDRGYMLTRFTHDAATAEWVYVSSIKERSYSLLEERQQTLSVSVGANELSA